MNSESRICQGEIEAFTESRRVGSCCDTARVREQPSASETQPHVGAGMQGRRDFGSFHMSLRDLRNPVSHARGVDRVDLEGDLSNLRCIGPPRTSVDTGTHIRCRLAERFDEVSVPGVSNSSLGFAELMEGVHVNAVERDALLAGGMRWRRVDRFAGSADRVPGRGIAEGHCPAVIRDGIESTHSEMEWR